MKSRKRQAHDVMYTSATRARVVHDITDLFKMAVLTVVLFQLLDVEFDKLDPAFSAKLL